MEGALEMAGRTIVRITSVTVALSLVVGFAISAASADLPDCNGCVVKNDVAKGAIGSWEVRNRSLTKADLHNNALTRAGQVLLDSDASTASTTGAQLDKFTVTVPANGYLEVTVTGKYRFEIDTDPGDTNGHTEFGGWLALCTAKNVTSGSKCGASNVHERGIWYADADPDNGEDQSLYFTLTRTIFARKGLKNLFVNGKIDDAPESIHLIGPVRANVLFVPAKLKVTT